MKNSQVLDDNITVLVEFEVRPTITVLASSAEEARQITIECLNRGMCNTSKMQRRVSHDAAGLVVIDPFKI